MAGLGAEVISPPRPEPRRCCAPAIFPPCLPRGASSSPVCPHVGANPVNASPPALSEAMRFLATRRVSRSFSDEKQCALPWLRECPFYCGKNLSLGGKGRYRRKMSILSANPFVRKSPNFWVSTSLRFPNEKRRHPFSNLRLPPASLRPVSIRTMPSEGCPISMQIKTHSLPPFIDKGEVCFDTSCKHESRLERSAA